ncbi:MAG TPA: hypothetical protein VKM94_04710 [Blastocatellia bacterium]|nr:hypothetical protein [Blastocatellia bacterium]
MPLDHSNADVTILMDGLGLFCFNAQKECELAVLKNPRHSLTIDITRVTPQGFFPIQHDLDLTMAIEIDTNDMGTHETTPYMPTPFFYRRVGPIGGTHDDFEDFRWIVDLEGYPFHGKKLQINRHPRAFQIESELDPLIRIKQGVFYSARLTGQSSSGVQDLFKLVDWSVTPPRILLGNITIGDVVGVDISIQRTSGSVFIRNPDDLARSVTLQKQPNTRYLIYVKNECTIPPDPSLVGSDFRRYYDVVEDPTTSVKFDFEKSSTKGKFPQNCDLVFLGQTNSLGRP